MILSKKVSIARRFLRSVRIDTDLGEGSALDGFVCPQSSAEVLMVMARHVLETQQGAFTWTGPYGSGKSSLVVALSALLNGNANLQKRATKVFGHKLAKTIWNAFPTGTRGWRVLPVVGRRDSPVNVIGEAVKNTGLVSRTPRGGWNERNLVSSLIDAAQAHPRMHGGLILFIDEMGKFFEASSQDGADIFVFQELAEAASRSNGRLIVIGILHQSFEEYACRLSYEMRNEWAKVQGRFIDLIVDTAGEEQMELISRAIVGNNDNPGKIKRYANTIAKISRRERRTDATHLASLLESCWPLHPVVAILLGSLSRRRFGQNQRSIFGFLNSPEPYGFQDYLNHVTISELYGPDRLWDYLRANLEPSILASPDGHRWALTVEAIERCELAGGDNLHLKLLKTIAVIDLFKDNSGLVASLEVLRTCVSSAPESKVKGALANLNKWSFTIFKKFLKAHAIYAGSDFDIEKALHASINRIDEIDFNMLNEFAGIQPILAKRHYHDTGTMRWFDVNIVPVDKIVEYAKSYKPENGAIGQFLLAIPTKEENDHVAYGLCRQASRLSHKDNHDWDIVVGISERSRVIISLARELLAMEDVSNSHPELAGDSVARREVLARLADLQSLLEAELRKAFDNAKWFRKHHSEKYLCQADLNGIASELADSRFQKTPILKNELLNRQNPSGSAIAAQNNLLRCMVLNNRKYRIGIEGFPAEGGLFISLLEATGLYVKSSKEYSFVHPSDSGDDNANLKPIWDAALEYIKENSDRTVRLSEVFKIWRSPPFGVKDGLMPTLIVAFILSKYNKLAIYREDVFRAKFDDVDVELLAKNPGLISLRWMTLDNNSRNLLSGMAEIISDLDMNNKLVHHEPVDVARGLIAIYDQLPSWTKRTTHLSENAINVRDLFKHAKDPNKIIFNDLPGMLSKKFTVMDDDELQCIIKTVRDGFEELMSAYPAMLTRMRELMLAELSVPNDSPQSITELRERAENIMQLSGDFRLENFVSRLAQFDSSTKSFEGIASLAANKPPRDWVDIDLNKTTLELADMAQKFVRAETFAHIKGRHDKRQALAVVVGINGRQTPILSEFDVGDSDRKEINALIERMSQILETTDAKSRNVILAALAELSAHYINADAQSEDNTKQERSAHV